MVQGLGTNLFSVTAAMLKGLATLFHPTHPRLEKDGVVVPMQQVGVYDTTGNVMYSIKVKLGGGARDQMVLGDNPYGLALKAESAKLRHRCMGRINGKSLDVLRKEPGNGVDYTGAVKNCDSCPLGKSKQQSHPKQATYGVLRLFQLTTVGTMGPFQPEALGGFRYATKFVDQKIKWKKIYLVKNKTHSVDSLALFTKGTVISTGERIQRLQGDQGTELTNVDVRHYCLDTGIKLEFASQNTPQQIGANERAGRTNINIVRCPLADSGLPKFLWGEPMQTLVFLSNRSPHAPLNNGTPYNALYGKNDYLGHRRVIGSRAFVHHEIYTRSWSTSLVKDALSGTAWTASRIGSTTPKRDVCKRVKVLSSLTHLPSCLRHMLVTMMGSSPTTATTW